MKKKEVISRLCKLATRVASLKFGHKHASDCFCESAVLRVGFNFQFSPEVVRFIEEAVAEKLSRDT